MDFNSAVPSQLSFAMLGLVFSTLGHAGIAEGERWLAAQATTSSRQALDLQTYAESLHTLSLLQTGALPAADLANLLQDERSTEGLARAASIAHHQQSGLAVTSSYLTQLLAHQNADGGFGHLAGWQSNPLDTAYVLLALNHTNFISQLSSSTEMSRWSNAVQQALSYLIAQQRTNGSYQVLSLDQLYVSAYVLSALTPHVAQQSHLIPVIQRLVDFLNAAQVAPAQWSQHSQGLFIDALVAEALHPYQDAFGQNMQTAFRNRVDALQQQNGSWNNDPYVTALVLRSLQQQSTTVQNPIVAGVALTVLDAETGLPLSNATLTAQADSPAAINGLSDTNGQIILNDLPAGRYSFSLSRDGYIPVTVSVALRQGERINLGALRLSRSANSAVGMIQGTVKDSVTGTVLSGAQVTVVLVDSSGQPLAGVAPIIVHTTADGTYQVITQQPSAFGIDIRKEGYVPQNGNGQTTAGGVIFFSPTLQTTANFSAAISGKVTNEQNQPLSGAEIVSNGQILAVTDPLGNFSYTLTTPSEQVWTVKKSGHLTTTLNVAVTQSQALSVGVIKLPLQSATNPDQTSISMGQLDLEMIDYYSRQVIDGFDLVAEMLDSANNVTQRQFFASSQENGEYLHRAKINLPVGRWRITTQHPAYYDSARTYTIKASETLSVDHTASLRPYSITGTVVDSQTNRLLSGIPVKIFDQNNGSNVWSGVTDSLGRLNVTFNSNPRSSIRVEVTPTFQLHLGTTRYLNRDLQTDSTIDFGEIRLRPLQLENALPDLQAQTVDASSLFTDQQSLSMQGNLKVNLLNKGESDAVAGFEVTAFVDVNKNRKIDDDELVVGRQTVTNGLGKKQTQTLTIPVQGRLPFRDYPIAVLVDSSEKISEKNEQNNSRSSSDGIEIKPPVGTMDTEVLWQLPLNSDSGVTVAPLQDTNLDGVIGMGDIASILVHSNGYHHVVNGKTGQLEFKLESVGTQTILAAIGDVDGDRLPDIVLPHTGELRIYSNTGVLKKRIAASIRLSDWAFNARHPILADLDKDGKTEIVVDNKIFNYDRGLIVDNLSSGSSQAVADVDGDGLPEIIGLEGVTRPDGTQLYQFKNKQGTKIDLKFLAVGDVLGLKTPQIVAVYSSNIVIFDPKTGSMLNNYTGPSGMGGSPVIADFDGDGISDIGVAQNGLYMAMRGDGSVIWSTRIKDGSGGTGSTVFDFDGDGNSEAVHFDEEFIRIFDSKTGIERIKLPNDALTAHESPVVADVDGDGHADIITTSSYSHHGLRVISSKNKDWANTRNIWNQYSYHVTNINDDLSVPQFEPNSWEVHNTYRANWLPTNSVAAADLTASFIQIEDKGWLSDSVLKARVGNAGGKRVPAGTPVSFYRIPPAVNGIAQAPILLHVGALSKALDAGDYEDLAINYSGSLAEFGELVVVANDAGAGIDSLTGLPADQPNAAIIQEYSRANNLARLAIGGGFQTYTLSGSLNQLAYQPNQAVQITAQAANLGSFDADATVRMTILDSVGNVLSVLPAHAVRLLAEPDQSVSVTSSWNTGNQRLGSYAVRIELIRPTLFGDDEVVASTEQTFSIGSNADTTVGLVEARVFTDKASYNSLDVINATLQLRNTASNQVAGARTTAIELISPTGEVLWTQQSQLAELPPNGLEQRDWQIPLSNLPVGLYVLRSTTHAEDGSQADQIRNQSISVVSNAESLIGISGNLAIDQTQVNVGEQVRLTWSIQNQAGALDQLPTRIVLVNEDTGQRVGAPLYQGVIDLPQRGSSAAQTTLWDSSIDASQLDQPLQVMLQVQQQNGLVGEAQWRALSSQPLKISQPPLKIEIGVDGQDSELNQASGAPLLVYYSCHEGWHNAVRAWSAGIFEDQCFAQRATQIKPYLDRLNIPYTLVKSPWQFRTQLRSGVYGQYWMLGAVEQLTPHTFYELREAAHRGDGLLVDSGMHSWSNEHLFALAGADPQGRLRLADGLLTVQPIANNGLVPPLLRAPTDPAVAAAPLSSITARRGQPLSTNWPSLLEPLTPSTQVAATFDGRHRLDVWFAGLFGRTVPQQTYPAITTAPYGQGYPVGLAFDLMSTLQQASQSSPQPNYRQQRWDQVLQDFSRPRRSAPRTVYVPAEVVRIPVYLNNQSSSPRSLNVVVDLPNGSVWQGQRGGLDTLQNGQPSTGSTSAQVSFTVTIPANTSQTQQLTLRLPKQTGTAVVRTRIYSSDAQGASTGLLAEQESRFAVRSIDERLALLKQTIHGWRILGADGLHVVQLKVKLALIEKHLRLGLLDLAVVETAHLAATLAQMNGSSNPQIRSTRLEAGELLKAIEIKWYLEDPDKNDK